MEAIEIIGAVLVVVSGWGFAIVLARQVDRQRKSLALRDGGLRSGVEEFLRSMDGYPGSGEPGHCDKCTIRYFQKILEGRHGDG